MSSLVNRLRTAPLPLPHPAFLARIEEVAAAGFMHGGVNRQFSYGYLCGSNLLHTLTQPNGITLTQSYEEHRDLLTGMQYHRGSTLVVERSYSEDKAPDGCKGDWTNAQHLPEGRGAVGRLRVTLGRPTNRSTARQGSVKNDTFTHNDRSESARQSPRRLVGGLAKCAAFAPEGRAANGVAARQPRLGRLRQQAVRAIGQTRSVCPAGARSREAAPSQVFGSDGYIKTAYTYTPYGTVTATGNVTQPIRWSSEYSDSELGLVYYNYRHYNPADGRWTGRDFLDYHDCYNLHTYCSNNIFISDHLGLGIVGWFIKRVGSKLIRRKPIYKKSVMRQAIAKNVDVESAEGRRIARQLSRSISYRKKGMKLSHHIAPKAKPGYRNHFHTSNKNEHGHVFYSCATIILDNVSNTQNISKECEFIIDIQELSLPSRFLI